MHHVPLAQEIFGLTPLSLRDVLLALTAGLVPVTMLEVAKLVRRGRR